MATIGNENGKILRKSLDVIVGVDIAQTSIDEVTPSNNYAGSSGTVNNEPGRVTLMDLSNGGFLNDGEAIPLDTSVKGILSKIGETLTLTITLGESTTKPVVLYGYLGGQLHKWEFSGSGSVRTITISASDARILITRVVCGDAWWFDNTNLISCNVQLRGVETKVDNPELQMSEIEFEGYEPNNITDKIGYIGTGYPIYYTCGYYGDMSPIRKFYLGEPIEWEDNQIKIKGYDATYFIDSEYSGELVGRAYNVYGNGGGFWRYYWLLRDMLESSGVDVTGAQGSVGVPYTDGAMFFVPNISKRKILAQAVNLFHFYVSNPFGTGQIPLYIDYVDAGRPLLGFNRPAISYVKTLNYISKPRITAEAAIKTIQINVYRVSIAPNVEEVETIDVDNRMIQSVQNPYVQFFANNGSIQTITPYTFVITANGSTVITGQPIRFSDDSGASFTPLSETASTPGETIELEPFYCQDMFSNGSVFSSGFWREVLQGLLNRSNILYTFEYRGDPSLQPRDYIQADIDGSGTLVQMTIESISTNHENGGTISTITARRGLI